VSLTLTDLFCGAGGSGLGADAVPGVELVMAANHWPVAIDTHQSNFPDVDHDCADISQVDPRRYPATDLLWASPECTNHSVAKGRRRQAAQPGLFGDDPNDPGAERSRATMWDVPRFAEQHRYRAIVVENVVEAARWVMWPAWLHAMTCMGYRHRVVYLNSMHAPALATPRAPQSRDRLYVVFWRAGQSAPDLDLRPAAECGPCGEEVAAVQTWKHPGRERWSRYRAQYLYRCPRAACRQSVVEPYAAPAASVIDWALPGVRIGDRARPLSVNTVARIRAGLTRYADPGTAAVPGESAGSAGTPSRSRASREVPALVVPYYGTGVAHGTAQPLRTLTTRDRFGVAFIAELRGGRSDARDVAQPLATVTASGNHHMLVRHNTARGNPAQMSSPVAQPARTITTAGHQSLVGRPHPTPDIAECTFRMLEPAEIQAAMAFHPGYRVTGTRRQQVRQLGNGVTPPAAEWLLRAVAASLNGIPS
jgi:DNA (cytosine-5)-methyltransferase 1